MLLTDQQIVDRVLDGTLVIDPFISTKVTTDVTEMGARLVSYGLQSFGYDIRLDSKWAVYRKATDHPYSARRVFETDVIRHDSPEGWVIPPHGFCLAQSLERFKMPDNVLGIVMGKSSWARVGIVVNCTPLEPGWYGHITLELSNTTENPVQTLPGQGIAQVLFFQGDERPMYGYDGAYNGQEVPQIPY